MIERAEARLAEIVPSLPGGTEIVSVYDRSGLIERAMDALKGTLIEESIIVALVCVVFLLHLRSALVAIIMLPVGILMAFAAMKALGLQLKPRREPRRHRDCRRRHDRCRHRHNRKRPQAP